MRELSESGCCSYNHSLFMLEQQTCSWQEGGRQKGGTVCTQVPELP